jgi:ABC-2 type transport system permease protein
MISLLWKEINGFFSSITGYLVIITFLLINASFLWLFSGNFNLIESGYASIDGLFLISPWVFMFLIPAITMRLFADEKRLGTLELILTKPLTELQIILSKYLAGLLLVVFSLLPTLIYFYSIYQLGNPVGNIDVGGTVGSYIGLLFLGASYTAIGLFASSLTDNQIVSFIISLALCFFFYFGFDQIAASDVFGSLNLLIYSLGINEHYISMSRGVIDSRDVLYFLSLIAAFLLATRLTLQSRKW